MAVRVLSIDGGDIRGILPATVLVMLEQLSGRRIFELFDVVVGTSTGGILALALTCPLADGRPRTAADVRSIYLDRGERIFPLGGLPVVNTGGLRSRLLGERTPLRAGATVEERFRHFMGHENVARLGAATGGNGAQGNARYPAQPLEAELGEQLGEVRMSAALRPVAVVSCDFTTATPLVFVGGGLPQGDLGDTAMRHVARATSAAPTFFPPLSYRDVRGRQRACVDGGLVANDPAMVGYVLAQSLAPSDGRTLLVSLGTGEAAATGAGEAEIAAQLAGSRPWWDMAAPLARTLSGGPGRLSRDLLGALPSVTYLRIQPTLTHGASPAMDDARPENTRALRLCAEAYAETNRAGLQELVGELTTPG